MKPYYQDNFVTLYHGNSYEFQPEGDVLLTDPPWGIGYKSNHNSGSGLYPRSENFSPIVGDDKRFEPSTFLRFKRHAIFGANFFCRSLPETRSWVIWDKRVNTPSDQAADCEMIWTDSGKQARIFRHLWRGIIRAGEENVSRQKKLHPNQKSVALMRFLIDYLDAKSHGIIYDPFCGSGTTLRAAKDLGLKAVGVEIEEKYCEITATRLQQEVLPFS